LCCGAAWGVQKEVATVDFVRTGIAAAKSWCAVATNITSGTLDAARLPATIASNTTGSAASLTTSRQLAVNLANTTGKTMFNGTTNLTGIQVTGILPVTHGGTGGTSLKTINGESIVGTGDIAAGGASGTCVISGPMQSKTCQFGGKVLVFSGEITNSNAELEIQGLSAVSEGKCLIVGSGADPEWCGYQNNKDNILVSCSNSKPMFINCTIMLQ
jgi:hypothetical protein